MTRSDLTPNTKEDRGLDWEARPDGMPVRVLTERYVCPGELSRLAGLARLCLPPMYPADDASLLSDALDTLAGALERAGLGDPDVAPETCHPAYWLCLGAIVGGDEVFATWRALDTVPPVELARRSEGLLEAVASGCRRG